MRLKIPHQTQLSSLAPARRHVSWFPLCRWRLDSSLYSDLLNQSLSLALFMSSFSLRYKGGMIHFCPDVLKEAHVSFTSVQCTLCQRFVKTAVALSSESQSTKAVYLKDFRIPYFYKHNNKKCTIATTKPHKTCQVERGTKWTLCSFKTHSH